MDLKKYIADIQDFPIEGVLFRDVTPLMQDGEAYHYTIDQMISYAKSKSLGLKQEDSYLVVLFLMV